MGFVPPPEWRDPEAIRAKQSELLPQAVRRAAQSPAYRKKFADAGLDPSSVRGLDDLRRLPLTTKEDLRREMPYGFLAVPLREVLRMHYSSGTTGIATAVYHTRGDLDRWAECCARGMQIVGAGPEDVFQNMMGYGLFTGGLGLHYAAERIGCMTIPAGSGNTARQVHLLRTFGVTVIHILPSYAARVLAYCREQGLDPAGDLALRTAHVGAEPHSEDTRRRIEQAFDIKVYNCFGLSEMQGPGVAMECEAQDGLHVWGDHFIVEILHPETLEPLPEGEEGELVLTTLTREAMPLLRYRTRDLTRLIPGICPCGLAHPRVARLTGRTDDMIIVKGVNIYPLQVEQVLMRVPEFGSNWQIVLETAGELDDMIVKVELRPGVGFDDMRELDALRQRVIQDLRAELLVTPKLQVLEPNALPIAEGKAQRVLDNREQPEPDEEAAGDKHGSG